MYVSSGLSEIMVHFQTGELITKRYIIKPYKSRCDF